MKRFLPLMAALAILLWLPVGASAYTITWGSTQQSTDPEATLNGTSGDFFSNPAVVDQWLHPLRLHSLEHDYG